MAMSAFISVTSRTSRSCARLSLGSRVGLRREFQQGGMLNRTIVSFSGSSTGYDGFIYRAYNNDACSTQSRIRGNKYCIPNSPWQLSGQQKRWSANNRPDDGQTQPPPKAPQPDTTKSRILSRVPLKTREDIYNIPNMLTFSRLIAAPFVGYFLVHNHHAAALALFAYAGITDLVDGYLARRWQLQTVVGTIIDPMADKLLMTIGVACLAVNGSIPVWLAVIILGRDVGLALSAIYYRWISLPPPKTMARYWDFSLPSAEVKPTEISKINTALQLFLVGSAIGMPVLPETILSAWHLKEAMTGFQYLVAATTLWSGLSYVFSKDAVKILTNEEVQKRIARAAAEKQKKNP